MLGDNRFSSTRRHSRVNFNCRIVTRETAQHPDCAGRHVVLADFGTTRPEADHDIDHHDACVAGCLEQVCCAAEKRLLFGCIAINDELLEIHDKQGGAFAIDENRVGHDVIPSWDLDGSDAGSC